MRAELFVSPLTRRAKIVVGVAVVLATCALVGALYAHGRSLRDHYDDAYITYRYALQLGRGHGLVFNVGERMDSASSFLFTIVLACFYRLGAHDLEAVAMVLAFLCTGGIAGIVYATTLRLGLPTWISVSAGLLAGLHGLVSGWSMSGMETGFYALLVTWFVSEALLRSEPSWSAPVAASLVILTRVEGLVVLVPWAVDELLQRRRQESTGSGSLRRLLAYAAIPVLVAAAFFLFKYLYYGTLLPHAYHLKRILRPYQPNATELFDAWLKTAFIPLMLALAGAVLLWRKRAKGAVGVALLLVLTAASCALGPRAAWGRYSAHMLPTIMILAAFAVGTLARRTAGLGAVLVLATSAQTAASCWIFRDYLKSFGEHQRCRRQVGEYLNAHVSPSELILSSDIGRIAYVAADFSFADTVGLTSIDIYEQYRGGGIPCSRSGSQDSQLIRGHLGGFPGGANTRPRTKWRDLRVC